MIEVTHVNVRMSISVLVGKLIVLYGLVAIISVGLFIPEEFVYQMFALDTRLYIALISIFMNLAELFFAIWIILSWLCEYYEIRPDRLTYRSGIVFRQEERFSTKNITAVECTESFLGELFNFGNITLYDFVNQKTIRMHTLHNPKRCFSILKQILPEVNQRSDFMVKPSMADTDRTA